MYDQIAMPKTSRWTPIVLLLLASAALFIRTAGLQATGVGGNDTILYYSLAEQWLEGNPVYRIGNSVEVFRPVLLAYNALSLKLLGHSDYAIKLANAVVDSLNVLLVAFVAWLLSRRLLVCLASALAYTLLPLAIWAARQELPHTLSTFFVLLALVSTLMAAGGGYRQRWLGGLGGFFLGFAVLTHEELVFIAAPLAIVLLLSPRLMGEIDTIRAACWRLGPFLFGPAAAALLILWHESAALRVLSEPAALTVGQRFYPEVLGRFFWNGLSGAGSLVFLALIGVGFAVFIWQSLPPYREGGRRYRLAYLFCMGTFIVFLALYALFFDTLFVRGLLPMIPLQLIAIVYSLAIAFEPLGRVPSAAMVLLLALGLGISNIGAYSAFKVGNRDYSDHWDIPEWPDRESWEKGYRGFRYDALYDPSYYTHWANVHAALAGRVDEQNRLLLLPSSAIYSPGRRPLQTSVYFGDNVVYRLDHTDQPLEELVRSKHIRYVLFTLGQRRRIPGHYSRYLYDGRWAEPQALDLARDYGMERYSEQAEFHQLMQLLESAGARPLDLFPADSFEADRARVWVLP